MLINFKQHVFCFYPVKRLKCHGPLGLECGKGTLNVSSIFSSGYDAETARFNVWIDANSVEGGWAPNLNDPEVWVMVR